MSIQIRKEKTDKVLGLYGPKSILVLEGDCEVEMGLEVLDLKAESLLVHGKEIKSKWNIEVKGDLIIKSEDSLIEAGGYIKVNGLLKAQTIRAGKYIEADTIEAQNIETGRGYSLIVNSVSGEPNIRGRLIKKGP